MRKVILIIIIILFSCGNRKENLPPDVLAQQDMIDVLVELQILESAYKLNLVPYINSDTLALVDYYDAVFKDKTYSLEDFKRSYNYYAKQPDEIEKLFDSTLTRIQLLEMN
jgi:hypothetical protein